MSAIAGARLPRDKFSRDKLGCEADGGVVLYLHPLAQFPDCKSGRAPKSFQGEECFVLFRCQCDLSFQRCFAETQKLSQCVAETGKRVVIVVL